MKYVQRDIVEVNFCFLMEQANLILRLLFLIMSYKMLRVSFILF